MEYARAWVRDALQEWEEEKAKINLPKPAKHVGNNPLKLPEEYKLTSGSQWEQEPPELSGFPPLGSPDALDYTKEDGAWIKSQLEQTKQAMSRARGNSFLANDPFAKLHPGSQGNLWKLPSQGFEEKNPFGEESDPFGIGPLESPVNWEDGLAELTQQRDVWQQRWTDWNNVMYQKELEQKRLELENSALEDPEFGTRVKEGEKTLEELFKIAFYGGKGRGMLDDRDTMTEEEKPYYYYYLSKGREEEYKETLRRKLVARTNSRMVQDAKEYAEEDPVGAGLFSVPSKIFGVGGTLLDVAAGRTGSPDSPYKPSANPNTSGQRTQHVNDVYRNTGLEMLEGNPLAQGALNIAYGVADTIPALMMSSAGAPSLGLAYMSLMEGEEAYADAASRGATNDEAVLSGVGMAAITAALEQAPMKKLTNIFTGGKQEGTSILMDIFFSAKKGATGSYWEQVAGTAWDEAVMQGKSRVSEMTYQLMEENHCDWKTANSLAKEKFYKSDAMYAALLGGLSTAILAAGGHAWNGFLDARQGAQARQVYGELMQAGEAPQGGLLSGERAYLELAGGGPGTGLARTGEASGGQGGLALPGEGVQPPAAGNWSGQAFFPPGPDAGLTPQPQDRASVQIQAGEEAARGLIQLLLNQGEITPEEAAGLMAQNGGAEILYPEQPAVELPQLIDPQEADALQNFEPDDRWRLPDWYEERLGNSGLVPQEAGSVLPEQSQTYSQSQAGDEAARGLIQLLLDQGEITPEEAAGLMAQNGGAEILYPEQPAAELPDWAAEGMEKFGIPELSGEQTLPEQSQTSPQNQAGDEAAQALIQLLLDQGDITPEEAAELTNQGEKRIQIPDWDYGEPEELVSGYPLGWKKPGAFPEEKRGVSRLRGSSRRPQSGRLLPGIESFLPGEFRGGKDLFPQGNGLPEEFQRPQGLSDWDWSLRQGEAAEAKSDLERSAALYGVGRTKLNAAKRISEELGRKVVFDGTMTVDKTGAIDPETGTIRLNARVGGPENLFDNAVRLLEEQEAESPLDSADAGGYNAGEERLLLEAAGADGNRTDLLPLENGPYIKNGKPNGRPQLSGEKRLQFEKKVYENSVGSDGILRDPNTGEIIDWKPGQPRKGVVDFGHKPGNSYNVMFQKYKNREITLEELEEFQFDPNNYRLETPSANRGHKYE